MESIENYLDILYNMENQDHITQSEILLLKDLSHHNDDEIRTYVARNLGLFYSYEAEAILVSMINDKNEQVRTEVCDSLGNSKSKDILKVLKPKIFDHYFLVRGYAVLSIADITLKAGIDVDIRNFLQVSFRKERSTWVQIAYARSLYLLGEKEMLSFLLEKLNHRYYSIRIMVVRSLGDILNESNQQLILSSLQNRLLIEKGVSVQRAIESICN